MDRIHGGTESAAFRAETGLQARRRRLRRGLRPLNPNPPAKGTPMTNPETPFRHGRRRGAAPSSARCNRRAAEFHCSMELVAGALALRSREGPAVRTGPGPGPGPQPRRLAVPSWPTNCAGRFPSGSTSWSSSRPTTCTSPWPRAFTEAGIHVVCDKPLVHTSAQAAELLDLSRRREDGVRRHLQLHRLPAGAARPGDGAQRQTGPGPQGRGGVQPGLAGPAAGVGPGQQAGGVAHRSGPQRHRRRHRRHRLPTPRTWCPRSPAWNWMPSAPT